jgi:hypothetical protein
VITKENLSIFFLDLNWTHDMFDAMLLAATTKVVKTAISVKEGVPILLEEFTATI